MTRSFASLLVLLPSVALAQSWSLTHASGVAVMDESSTVMFRATNTSATSSGIQLNEITLQLDHNRYEVEGGVAPAGWRVATVDKNNRTIVFQTDASCGGLAPGASALFGIRAIGVAVNSDVSDDRFITNGTKTFARDTCRSNGSAGTPSGNGPTWMRVGLSSSVSVSPRALDVNDQVTVVLTVTNRSTREQTLIAPSTPQVVPGSSAGFSVTSGPTVQFLRLAQGETGSTQWTVAATRRGLARIQLSAQNPSVSSPLAQSQMLNVGEFPGEVSASPEETTNGSIVTVSLTVANNSSAPYQNVVPIAPTMTGTATAAPLTGPVPTSLSSLSPGAATRFKWTYRIMGEPGDTFDFTTQASATRDGVSISTDPVSSSNGRIVSHTVTPAPFALPSRATNPTVAYTVSNGGAETLTKVALIIPDAAWFPLSANPFVAAPAGWTATRPGGGLKTLLWEAPINGGIPAGGSETFTVRFGSLGSVSQITHFSHRWILTQRDGLTSRAEGDVTLFVSRAVPDVSSAGVTSGVNRNTLTWNNPVDHNGVLILRSVGAPPDSLPVMGTRYEAGMTLGNAQVAYADADSFTSSVTDTGLTNGTRYFYKIYNHDEFFVYSPGNQPTSAGVLSVPTSRVSPDPLWCYSFGLPTSLQPVTQLGSTVFTASNAGAVTASTISTNTALDGQERWRPVKLTGPVQGRFLVSPLAGLTGQYIVTGDQSGYAYAIDASTGGIAWTGLGGARLGDAIQAQPTIQFRQFSNSTFQTAQAGDLVFLATRNSSMINNRVFALRGRDGTQAWAYSPGNLDIISGGMAVDYVNNRLWVASRAGPDGTQPSLRVLSTVTGQVLQSFALGDIDHAVNIDYVNGVAKNVIVVSNSGQVHAFDLATMTQAWGPFAVGTMTSYPVPTGNGFIAPLASGTIQRFTVDPAANQITPLWQSPPSVPNPSGVRIEYASQKLYVGDSAGMLHQINVATGVDEKQLQISTQQVGMPTIDTSMSPKRLHVGLNDGRLCALEVPF